MHGLSKDTILQIYFEVDNTNILFVYLLAVPVLRPGPRPWRSSTGYQCRRQGRSAASSAQPCPDSGC